MQNTLRNILSKSTFMMSGQYLSSLWLYMYQPELRTEVSNQQKVILDKVTNFGNSPEGLRKIVVVSILKYYFINH